ncbi:hypothetical protein MW887_000241 [Aspergillus wentii]|nr:hypothetical protein MW887_000241 [Aspergillus wentii]
MTLGHFKLFCDDLQNNGVVPLRGQVDHVHFSQRTARGEAPFSIKLAADGLLGFGFYSDTSYTLPAIEGDGLSSRLDPDSFYPLGLNNSSRGEEQKVDCSTEILVPTQGQLAESWLTGRFEQTTGLHTI